MLLKIGLFIVNLDIVIWFVMVVVMVVINCCVYIYMVICYLLIRKNVLIFMLFCVMVFGLRLNGFGNIIIGINLIFLLDYIKKMINY